MILRIPEFIAKPLLYFTHFFNDNKIILLCKGYNEDYHNFTGLYWDEDKDLDLFEEVYEDFQLWIY